MKKEEDKMENNLGVRNRNASLYHQILEEKLEIFNIGTYECLRKSIRENRIKEGKTGSTRNGDIKYLLFTPSYGVAPMLYPSTFEEYLEENRVWMKNGN